MNNSLISVDLTTKKLPALELLLCLRPFISKVGISRIVAITHLDSICVPTFLAIRPESKFLSTSQGKGLTDDLAKCSAIMEAIEHHYAENVQVECTASFISLDTQHKISPSLFSHNNFIHRKAEHINIDWVSAYELTSKNIFYIPADLVRFDLTQTAVTSSLFKRSTTGLAAGNDHEEALLHALLEIIERNCLAEFHHLTRPEKDKKRIYTNSINDVTLQDLLNKISIANASIAIFEITNVFNIPAFHCVIADNNPLRGLGQYAGSGAHVNKAIALCRAITEACQSRLTAIAGSRDDIDYKKYSTVMPQWTATETIDYKNIIDIPFENFEHTISQVTEKFYQLGYDKILIYPHTQPSDNITVLHAIVPNLKV